MIAMVVVCMGSKATLLDETITLVISFSYQMVASYIYISSCVQDEALHSFKNQSLYKSSLPVKGKP